MYIILILFFFSLVGIILMIGKKLVLLRRNQLITENNFPIQIPSLQELGQVTRKNSKKYGFVLLVATIRFYVILINFLKRKYIVTKNSIIKHLPHKKAILPERKDSKFLKVISDYKHKIKRIKNKIEEEEKVQ